jgi:hypothetical protein
LAVSFSLNAPWGAFLLLNSFLLVFESLRSI